MINLDKHEWTFSKGEKYAFRWLEAHGFDVTIEKRFVSCDHLTVAKDGCVYRFWLPLGDNRINYKQVMEQFSSSFEGYVRLMKAGNKTGQQAR